MQRVLILGTLAALLVFLAGCHGVLIHATERFVLDIPWDNYEQVQVRTGNGGVVLTSGEGDEIRITGEKKAGGLTLGEARENLDQMTIVAAPDDTDPATLVVKLEFPEVLRYRQIGASFEVCVPEPCAADVATANGRIHVRGLRDRVVLRSSNGRIVAQDIAGIVDAETSNGRISVESISGDCRLSSSNGRIDVRDGGGSVWATTSNGDIAVAARPGPEGQVVLRTSNGRITADLPADLRGEVSLRTSNGRVSTDLGAAALTHLRWSKRALEAEMNGGGKGRIVAHTSNGSVRLNCR